jgi:RNA polymerase sigma-70 factor (ECF subfamily)
MSSISREPIRTRPTLLLRIRNWQDQASWREFYAIYRNLIYNAAVQAGLSPVEGDDIVQEVYLRVAKGIRNFEYDPMRGSFKGWLLTLTRHVIIDQFRKRPPARPPTQTGPDGRHRTPAVANIPDPHGDRLEAIWEEEWQRNLLAAAFQKLKPQFNPMHNRVFDLHMNQGLSAEATARAAGVAVDQVYLITHRITAALRKEVARLEEELI